MQRGTLSHPELNGVDDDFGVFFPFGNGILIDQVGFTFFPLPEDGIIIKESGFNDITGLLRAGTSYCSNQKNDENDSGYSGHGLTPF